MIDATEPEWRIVEKQVKVGGKPRYLWQAVDRAGDGLDVFVTEGRDAAAATRFLKRSLAKR